jgi:hypothetical protein
MTLDLRQIHSIPFNDRMIRRVGLALAGAYGAERGCRANVSAVRAQIYLPSCYLSANKGCKL